MPTPSLLIVPARFKSGKLYSQIPTSGAGDFTVTRNTEARRFNSAGLIESVASGIPRLDYFASGGVTGCPALLVEPAATNSVLQSTDSASGWALNNSMTRATIDVIGVSGVNLTVGASGSIGGAGSNYASPILSPALNLASGSTYTISFLAKKTTAHTILGYYVTVAGAAAGDIGGGFNVSGSFSSGSFYNTAGTTNRIRRVEQWGTDVYRCSETFTMTASGTVQRIIIGVLSAVNSATSAPTGTTMGFAAPQIELGSFPTSFIPTTTGQGSRSADVISVSGAVSGAIGQTEGTLYIECQSEFATNDIIVINTAGQSPGNNYLSITKTSENRFNARVNASGTLVSFTETSGITSFAKIAIAYASGNTACFINGIQIGSTSATGFSFSGALNNIRYIANLVAGAKPTRIRAVALYTTRLTNAELQSLTQL